MQQPLKFLLLFAAAYIVFNLVYQAILYTWSPLPDPFTLGVTRLTIAMFPDLTYQTITNIPGYKIMDKESVIVNIKEGCNGIAVWISVLCFIFAFRSNLKAYLCYIPLSFILIQISNILRLYILIRIKRNEPQYFNFFHTYAFPAIIYFFAFLLMVLWVKKFVKPATHFK